MENLQLYFSAEEFCVLQREKPLTLQLHFTAEERCGLRRGNLIKSHLKNKLCEAIFVENYNFLQKNTDHEIMDYEMLFLRKTCNYIFLQKSFVYYGEKTINIAIKFYCRRALRTAQRKPN